MNISNGWHNIGNGIIWTGPGPWLFAGVAFCLEFTKKSSNRCIYQGLWLWWYGFSANLLVCYAMCLWYSLFFGLFSFNIQDVYRNCYFLNISHTIIKTKMCIPVKWGWCMREYPFFANWRTVAYLTTRPFVATTLFTPSSGGCNHIGWNEWFC